MSSESNSSKSSNQACTEENIQHKSRLVRSASDNCNLAHSWAKAQSAQEANTVQVSLRSRLLSTSISLQEIASKIFNYTTTSTSAGISSDTSLCSDSTSPVCSPVSPKYPEVHIPSTVFEGIEVPSENTINQNNSNTDNSPEAGREAKEGSSVNEEEDGCEEEGSFFFWDQEEAKEKQVEQIGASACGATAILNVMNVLDMHPDLSVVASAVQTNLRAEDAPLPEYLFSRSVAGATHQALIEGLEKTTNGSVYAKFFAFYPKRKLDLKQWLSSWMRLGAVPLATLNLQAIPVNAEGDIHDAWHHQMIYGVDQNGVYMCNPIVMETYERMQLQLCSDAVLLVRRFDVLKRWHKNTNLSSLAIHKDPRWRELDVLGQAVDMLLGDPPTKPNSGNQEADDAKYEKELTDWFMRCHVRIPAAYTSGITLIVRKDNIGAFLKLMDATELPVDQDE